MWGKPQARARLREEQAHETARDAHHVDERRDDDVLALVVVRPKEDQQSHATRHQESGQHRRESERPLQVEVGDEHARRAVGGKAHERRQHRCQHWLRSQGLCDDVMPGTLYDKAEHKGDDGDKRRDLRRVDQRGTQDMTQTRSPTMDVGMRMTVGVTVTMVVEMGVRPVMRMCMTVPFSPA